MMRRVLVISDSVGLPRPKESMFYNDTYLSRLELDSHVWYLPSPAERLCVVLARVRQLADYLPGEFFDLAIIQVGLVDCAPRPLSYRQRLIVEGLPQRLQAPIIKALHVLRPFILRHVKYYQFTPLERFGQEYRDLIGAVKGKAKVVVAIGIAPVRDEVSEHSPGLKEQSFLYSRLIETVAHSNGIEFIPLDRLTYNEAFYLNTDGHIKSPAHDYIMNEITGIREASLA